MDTMKLTCSNVGIIKLFYVGGQEVCPHQQNFNVPVYKGENCIQREINLEMEDELCILLV
jgi:hypothetical protein